MRTEPIQDTVEILDLRHYTSADLRPLMELETEVWAKAMDWDYRNSAEMILRYMDSRILPGYVARKNQRIVGFSFFVYEGNKGVIGDLYVNSGIPESEHDQAIRFRILNHVIETLQQSPGVNRVEAQLLVHDTGEVSEPFLREGFHAHARLFMELRLRSRDMAPAVSPKGEIGLRGWSNSDITPVAGVITRSYFGHIDSEINDQYRTIPGSTRFLNNIVRFPGCGVFDAQASFVAYNQYTGELTGLLLCSRVHNDVGHITQVCVLPECRGRGIGAMLIDACVRNLRERGFEQLTLTVTKANLGAVELYQRLGFSTRRVFDAFVWEG